jgi:hypothetical protein
MVGLDRWRRNLPRIKENLSDGVGLVCGMKCGICDRSLLFNVRVHVGSPTPTISATFSLTSP